MSIITSLGAWLQANPLLAFVLWAALTSGVNWFFDWVKMHESDSKLARALDAIFAFVGVDAQGLIVFLRNLLGAPPNPGSGPPGGKGVFGPEPRSGFASQDASPRSKTPPPTSFNRRAASERREMIRRCHRPVTWLMSPFLALVIAAGSGSVTTGCTVLHAVVPDLEKTITYVTDLELVLKGVESIVSAFFLAAPNPSMQAQFEVLDRRVHEAADAAVRLADAGVSLDSQDMQTAMSDLQAAYADVESFLSKEGIPAPSGKVTAKYYRRPLVMSLHPKAR